ncbi:MAG: hypothetical protein C4524_08685 [Candidatus Zixiibacteriota bacterium]|nr:MAG: hypothetical protein C4524_08685 [candidate division Zixibacteria bacterium]
MPRIIAICLCALALAGCGGESAPSGPGQGVPIFSLEALPAQITPPADAQLRLTPLLPLDFQALDGYPVLFRNHLPQGRFNVLENLSYVDVDAPTGLNPETWYSYLGSDTTEDTIWAHVVTITGDTLAWNYCVITISGNQ